MATLTASGTISSGSVSVTVSAVVTYAVASTNETTTLNVTKIVLTRGSNASAALNPSFHSVTLSGAVSYSASYIGDDTRFSTKTINLSKTASWSRSSYTQQKTLTVTIQYLVSNNASTYTTKTATATISVPAFPEPQVSISKAYRCDSNGQPDDEGSYAAVESQFQIWNRTGNAVGSMLCDVTCPLDSSYTTVTRTASAASSNVQGDNEWTQTLVASGSWLAGTCKFVVDAGLDSEKAYRVTVLVSDSLLAGSKSASISTAFYAMDVLGDQFLYNLTEDTVIDQSKTYYARSGSGRINDPYVYEEVEDPDVSDIGSYYEANGMRPGHGITFFGVSNQEGLHVYNVGNNTFGNLTGFPGDESGVITVHSNILDVSDTTSTDVAHRVLTVKDANHRVFVNILARRMSSSNVLCIEAHNNRASDDAAVYNTLYLKVADDGTRTVTVSEAAPWRNALGASSGVWPISLGGTGATTAAAARTNLGLGSFATKNSLGLGIEAGQDSAVNANAQAAGTRFTVNITVGAKTGKMPISVAGVWASNNQVFSRGFDLDGLSTGGEAVVKTYWQANAAITASQVTFTAQILYIQTSYT